jgi:hypothetical protein
MPSRSLYIYGQVMGLRGPKAADIKQLQADAMAWATFLYTLRDGQSGYMQRLKWGPVQNTGSAQWTRLVAGRGGVVLPPNTQYRSSQPLGPPIPVPVSKAAQMLPPEMRTKDWFICRPLMPAPEIWELLKRARTVEQVRSTTRRISQWMDKEFGPVGRWLPDSPPTEFTSVLELHAEEFLIGKRLPSYAKTDRPRSDDKRVVLLSKILAGSRFGLTPVTAAKRLSHWHWPSDWAEKAQKEYLDWAKTEFAKLGTRAPDGPVEVLKMGSSKTGADAPSR